MKAIGSLSIAIAAAILLLTGCGKSGSGAADTAADTPANNLVVLQQAIQTFNTKEGHFPKALGELAPKYIATIPDAPSGFRFVYLPATGELKVSR